MCEICDGRTFEDMLAGRAARVAEYGYALQGVEALGGAVGWVYTAGLMDSARHPELIMAGVPPDPAASILEAIAESILDGERYDTGERLRLPDGHALRLGAVHPVQYERDTFAIWFGLQRTGAVRSPELAAFQVVPGAGFPGPWRRAQPRLSNPRVRL